MVTCKLGGRGCPEQAEPDCNFCPEHRAFFDEMRDNIYDQRFNGKKVGRPKNADRVDPLADLVDED